MKSKCSRELILVCRDIILYMNLALLVKDIVIIYVMVRVRSNTLFIQFK